MTEDSDIGHIQRTHSGIVERSHSDLLHAGQIHDAQGGASEGALGDDFKLPEVHIFDPAVGKGGNAHHPQFRGQGNILNLGVGKSLTAHIGKYAFKMECLEGGASRKGRFAYPYGVGKQSQLF